MGCGQSTAAPVSASSSDTPITAHSAATPKGKGEGGDTDQPLSQPQKQKQKQNSQSKSKTFVVINGVKKVKTHSKRNRHQRSGSEHLPRIPGLPVDEVKLLKEKFDEVDTDGSGCIDTDEFAQMLKVMTGQMPTHEQVMKYMEEMDDDGSNEVDFTEFATLMAKKVM